MTERLLVHVSANSWSLFYFPGWKYFQPRLAFLFCAIHLLFLQVLMPCAPNQVAVHNLSGVFFSCTMFLQHHCVASRISNKIGYCRVEWAMFLFVEVRVMFVSFFESLLHFSKEGSDDGLTILPICLVWFPPRGRFLLSLSSGSWRYCCHYTGEIVEGDRCVGILILRHCGWSYWDIREGVSTDFVKVISFEVIFKMKSINVDSDVEDFLICFKLHHQWHTQVCLACNRFLACRLASVNS